MCVSALGGELLRRRGDLTFSLSIAAIYYDSVLQCKRCSCSNEKGIIWPSLDMTTGSTFDLHHQTILIAVITAVTLAAVKTR